MDGTQGELSRPVLEFQRCCDGTEASAKTALADHLWRPSRKRAAPRRQVRQWLDGRRFVVVSVLAGVLVLADIRRGPQDEELQLAEYLDAHVIKRVWVMTKADKLSRAELARRLAELESEIDEPMIVPTTSAVADGSPIARCKVVRLSFTCGDSTRWESRTC